MGYLRIPYEGEDVTFLAVGDEVKYYVVDRNFVALKDTGEISVQDQVLNSNVATYKLVDGDYVPTNTYEANETYYIEDGTKSVDCPACGGSRSGVAGKPGFLIGDDGQYYLCPRCHGVGTIIETTKTVPVLSTTLTQVSTAKDGGYSVSYRIVPVGEESSIMLDASMIVD